MSSCMEVVNRWWGGVGYHFGTVSREISAGDIFLPFPVTTCLYPASQDHRNPLIPKPILDLFL